MRKIFGGFPPRYFGLLRLSLAACALRLVPWVPFFLAYFLPLGMWSKLLILFMPLLWYVVVGPVRIRYGEIVAAFAKDTAAPLKAGDLFVRERPWQHTTRERLQLMHGRALPLIVLSALVLLPLWMMGNVFAALKLVIGVPSWIASAAATAVAFIPRLIMGKALWVDAGVLGGAVTLGVLFAASLFICLWGIFQTVAYRFGYKRLPIRGALKPLRSQNLILWAPTLILLAALIVFAHQELLLLLANVLSVEAVFTVKLQPLHIVLAGLAAASYILLVPLRKYHTARWAAEHA